MALSATSIHEVQAAGSDSANSGIYDPGQTAGMFADGAATSATGTAPVFTSASYNFVAGDVGAKLFVASGTNWTPGWYPIASVAANAATLNATIGQAVVSVGTAGSAITFGLIPSLVVGCATTASPTGATWAIDYSQQTAAQFTYTDLASVGAGLLVSSVAFPFAKQQVGNSLVITGGTNFTAGRYVIASVAAGVATVVGAANITTGAGVNGTGGQGGAYASLGQAAAVIVASNQLFQKAGAYTITSASTNIAAGCWSTSLANLFISGYGSVRGDLLAPNSTASRPTNTASGISTFILMNLGAAGTDTVTTMVFDGASLTTGQGIASSAYLYKVHGRNFTNTAIAPNTAAGLRALLCSATGCSTVGAFGTTAVGGTYLNCVAYSNTFSGFVCGGFAAAFFDGCISYGNSGATSDGFGLNSQPSDAVNCVAYGNGRDGFRFGSGLGLGLVQNCHAESNTGAGYTQSNPNKMLINCAAFSNTGGNTVFTSATHQINQGFITLTASAFTNAAAGDFSLNNTTGGGALLRAAGYPGVFPVGLTTGYLDIGAAQHADAGATGTFVFGG